MPIVQIEGDKHKYLMKNIFHDNSAINNLIVKRICEEALSVEESAQLEEWLSVEGNREMYNSLLNEELLAEKLMQAHRINEEEDWNRLKERMNRPQPLIAFNSRVWWRYAAAAVIVFIIATGAYLWLTIDNRKQPIAITESQDKRFMTDKSPGKDGAVLRLANGTEIVLDNAINGLVAEQGKTEVLKKDGLVSYAPVIGAERKDIVYNTLSTPRGRQYQLALPDGSKIWLNAASSVKFPVAFSGKERAIEISGEAYLEVAKDARRPFKVHMVHPAGNSDGVWVEVLGTHFNVKAYHDEQEISTTLIEGKVRVQSGQSEAIITPGQQAQVKAKNVTVLENADTEEALAWKNGLMAVNRASLKDALKQLSRWYDVDIEFKNEIKAEDVRIRVPRNASLNDVLKVFELSSHLRFVLEGNKLSVWQL